MNAGLTKRQESLIRSLYTRHGRKKTGLCVCEGLRACSEILSLRPDLIELVVCEEGFDTSPLEVEPIIVPKDRLNRLSATIASQGILVVSQRPEKADEHIEPSDPFIFALDKIADPGNMGTIFRTARAVGLKEIWYTHGSADPYNEKVVRAAMASQYALTLREFATLQELVDSASHFGYAKFYSTTPHDGNNIYTEKSLFDKSVIIMGNEADGVSELASATPLIIPMPGDTESLNVAQAATIVLFEYVRTSLPESELQLV